MLLNGKAPLPGQIIKLPTLAQTFRAVAEHGKDGFYRGRVARAIVDVIRSQGGLMDLEDLEKHETLFVEPISYTYGGEVTLYEVSWHRAQYHVSPYRSVLQMAKVKLDCFVVKWPCSPSR
jgi:gamma-glutamyltranspeptidase